MIPWWGTTTGTSAAGDGRWSSLLGGNRIRAAAGQAGGGSSQTSRIGRIGLVLLAAAAALQAPAQAAANPDEQHAGPGIEWASTTSTTGFTVSVPQTNPALLGHDFDGDIGVRWLGASELNANGCPEANRRTTPLQWAVGVARGGLTANDVPMGDITDGWTLSADLGSIVPEWAERQRLNMGVRVEHGCPWVRLAPDETVILLCTPLHLYQAFQWG